MCDRRAGAYPCCRVLTLTLGTVWAILALWLLWMRLNGTQRWPT